MTVKELRQALESLPDEFEVILSKDAEGNNFSPLDEIQHGAYAEQTTYGGIWEETGEGEQNAICLWPVN